MAFKASRVTFFIALFVIMLFVRLFFDVLGGRIQRCWWWKAAAWCVKIINKSEKTTHPRSLFDGLMPSAFTKRRRHHTDLPLHGNEVGVV
jgi:hypothetical protein